MIAAIIAWVTVNWVNILGIISGIITVASILVKLTPNQEDDKVLAKIIAFLKILSLNK